LRDEGLSYSQIALKHFDETGDNVSSYAVYVALKRLDKRTQAP
jgi:hypothetical protein